MGQRRSGRIVRGRVDSRTGRQGGMPLSYAELPCAAMGCYCDENGRRGSAIQGGVMHSKPESELRIGRPDPPGFIPVGVRRYLGPRARAAVVPSLQLRLAQRTIRLTESQFAARSRRRCAGAFPR
jgi:hypothetical protein